MNWLDLAHIDELEGVHTKSYETPIVLFKHSTRCNISSIAKARLERESVSIEIPFYLLDLLKHRDVSNAIAEKYHVHHESPQILVIHKGECVLDESHNGIYMSIINEQLAQCV